MQHCGSSALRVCACVCLCVHDVPGLSVVASRWLRRRCRQTPPATRSSRTVCVASAPRTSGRCSGSLPRAATSPLFSAPSALTSRTSCTSTTCSARADTRCTLRSVAAPRAVRACVCGYRALLCGGDAWRARCCPRTVCLRRSRRRRRHARALAGRHWAVSRATPCWIARGVL